MRCKKQGRAFRISGGIPTDGLPARAAWGEFSPGEGPATGEQTTNYIHTSIMKTILLLGSGELGKEFAIAAQRLGQTVVIVTHDESLAARADRTITMSDGRIVG